MIKKPPVANHTHYTQVRVDLPYDVRRRIENGRFLSKLASGRHQRSRDDGTAEKLRVGSGRTQNDVVRYDDFIRVRSFFQLRTRRVAQTENQSGNIQRHAATTRVGRIWRMILIVLFSGGKKSSNRVTRLSSGSSYSDISFRFHSNFGFVVDL